MQLPITKFKLQPYQWQMAAIQRAVENDNFAFLADMGTGKTCAVINTLRCRFAQRGRIRRTLILAPLVTLQNWKNEFKIHSYVNSSDVVVLKGTGKAKLKRFMDSTEGRKKHKIVIVNYEALLNKELYKELFNYDFEILIADESHYCKTHNSKRSKAVVGIADKAHHTYILTGTPILNGVDDIFMQYRILDGGKTFGDSFYTFRNKYMMDMNQGFKHSQNYFPKFVTNPRTLDELNEKIYTKAVRVMKKDCLDLPPLVKKTINVGMNADQKRAYKEMERDFVTFVDQNTDQPRAVVAELAMVKAMRLQQIASGFVMDEDGKVFDFGKVPKLKQLEEMLETLTIDHKVIVWCAFRHNYKQIGDICDKLKLRHTFITGEQTLDQKQEAMGEFRRVDGASVIIANRRAGGIGINLVESDYSIVYSRNFSLNDELQSEARNYRGGSESHAKITKVDLVTEDTVEEKVVEALQNKQNISEKVIDLVKQV